MQITFTTYMLDDGRICLAVEEIDQSRDGSAPDHTASIHESEAEAMQIAINTLQQRKTAAEAQSLSFGG